MVDQAVIDLSALSGARILIVEDEFYLADDLACALKEAGAEVLGPAATLSEAQAYVDRNGFDCAILNMNLRGDLAFPVADRLAAGGIPFLIVTGYSSASLPERFAEVRRIEKPSDARKVVEALPRLLAERLKHL